VKLRESKQAFGITLHQTRLAKPKKQKCSDHLPKDQKIKALSKASVN